MKRTVLSRWIYYGINSALLILALVVNFSLINIGVFLAAELVMLLLFMLGQRKYSPAARDIPLLLFFDVLAYAGFMSLDLIDSFMDGGIEDGEVLAVLFIALVLALVGLAKRVRTLKWIAVMLAGLGGLAFIRGTAVFQFILYAAFASAWMCACITAERLDPKTAARNNWLGAALLTMFIAASFLESTVIVGLAPRWRRVLELAVGILSTPWQAFALTAFLVLCALSMCSFRPWYVELDAYVMLTFAALCATAAFAACRSFLYAPFILAAVFVLSVRRLGIYASGDSSRWTYPIVLASTGAGAMLLAYDGMWLTVIAVAATALILRRLRKKNPFFLESKTFWMLIPVCGFAVAASVLYYKRMSVQGLLVLLMSAAVTLAALWVLARPHPAGILPDSRYRVLICAAFAVICALTLCRGGVAVTNASVDEVSAGVTLSARGRDASIEHASCQWTDWVGNDMSGEFDISSAGSHNEYITGTRGERVVIRAADSNGVSTRTVLWVPLDLSGLLYS